MYLEDVIFSFYYTNVKLKNIKGGLYMLNKVKKNALNLFAVVLSFITIYTVNSCCMLILGQDEEPESLQRFRK